LEPSGALVVQSAGDVPVSEPLQFFSFEIVIGERRSTASVLRRGVVALGTPRT
jgi:hypothetical protein